jgi:hypothetical protein
VTAMDRLSVCGVYGSSGKSQVVAGEERVIVNVELSWSLCGVLLAGYAF